MSIADNYIACLQDFVNTEQESQNMEQRVIWHKSVSDRVAEGMAISDLRVIKNSDKQAVLQYQINKSKFREGDALRLNRGDPAIGGIKCELVEELEENQLIIKAGFGEFFKNFSPKDGWVLDMDVTDVREIQLSALKEIDANPDFRRKYRDLFTGRTSPLLCSQFGKKIITIPEPLQYNPKQTEAFEKAYQAQNFYLVQGPPGTGKTRVLAYLAETFAKEGKNVLITAFTHRAINNALKAIAKYTCYSFVIKVGQTVQAMDLEYENGKVPNYEYFADARVDPATKGMIIGGTCYAMRGRRLQDVNFDAVIVDEAGQLTLPLAMIAMQRAPKTIFFGDHKQMSPVITAKHEQEWVSKSIFETIYQYHPGTMLDTTYRMNQRIADFPSRYYYGGLLHPSLETGSRKLVLEKAPTKWKNVLDPEHPDVFVQIDHHYRTIDSIEEGRAAAEITVEAINCGVEAKEIAIVAPYRAQVRLIKNEIKKILSNTKIRREIVVDTVERIQGQEREMIIISLTTSEPAHAAKNAEFYFNPNRLNVAITRSRTKRIIIGSSSIFFAVPKSPEHQEWVRSFKNLYEQCEKIQVQ